MAAELAPAMGFAYPRDARMTAPFAEAAFLLFLCLIFVSLQPFATRDPAQLASGESGFPGAGDMLRQFSYLAAFVLILMSALHAGGTKVLACLSPTFAALLGWCVLSATWAAAPDVTFRRAVLEGVVVVSAMMGVAALGPDRSLALLRSTLGVILVINWFSIALVHNAVHQPGEIDPQLIGNWRGMFFHKNIAGSVSAITAILFFFEAWRTRRLANVFLFLAAVGFTVMTRSKSSLGLLPLALAAGAIYRVAWQRGIDRAIVMTTVALAGFLGLVLLAIESGLIAHFLSDPTELTGRTQIWQGEFAFIRDHLALGSGFGSFADTGAASPLRNYVAAAWVQNESHGHNAYLQMLVTIGLPGFLLAMLVFVALPMREFLRFEANRLDIKAALFAIFVFMILHNVLESDFLEGDGPAWVAFLLTLGVLRQLRSTPA
ncbi:MAG TPA: O-antigen ligase family protein [Rhizomicrobium sp.]|jgi:O-antigen ligase